MVIKLAAYKRKDNPLNADAKRQESEKTLIPNAADNNFL